MLIRVGKDVVPDGRPKYEQIQGHANKQAIVRCQEAHLFPLSIIDYLRDDDTDDDDDCYTDPRRKRRERRNEVEEDEGQQPESQDDLIFTGNHTQSMNASWNNATGDYDRCAFS